MIKKVAVVVLPGLSPFEFAVPCEVFGTDRSGLGAGLPTFDFVVCTLEPGLISTTTGFSIAVSEGLDAAADADLLIMVPSHSGDPLPTPVVELLRTAHLRGVRILSICSAAFALAESGLLDGRRATTHWKYSRQLAEQYPRVRVDENVLYVEDGTIITSAGTASGIDACLHLIRQEFGAKAANTIARAMVVPPHRDGGQAQYIERPIPARPGDAMEELLVWLRENLDQDFSVSDLAARMHMSDRTFARKFRSATGTTPGAWVNAQRLVSAQTLLEESELSIDSVARVSGFGQAVLLRHHFHKALGVSPASYRRTFQGTLGQRSPQSA